MRDVATSEWVPLREAWRRALYGPHGFYRHESPRDHFRTSPHVGPGFAVAIAALARRHDVEAVWDVGAGDGSLLADLARIAPDLSLAGVDVHGRPQGLPDSVCWHTELPADCPGLVVANELLDVVPCDVVTAGPDGTWRIDEVDLRSGERRAGGEPPPAALDWLTRWWPWPGTGGRAEIGLSRERFWTDICGRNRSGVCLAIDYGHLAEARPHDGSLSSYRTGRLRALDLTGSSDVTAHVAIDALAAAAGGVVRSQRDALADLRVSGTPPTRRASDPEVHLRTLARASADAELRAPSGLGGHSWVLSGPAYAPPRDLTD